MRLLPLWSELTDGVSQSLSQCDETLTNGSKLRPLLKPEGAEFSLLKHVHAIELTTPDSLCYMGMRN